LTQYWVPAFKGYYFNKKYSDNVEEGACVKQDVIAFTVNQGELSAIVLCDKAFTDIRLHDKPVKAFESKYWDDDKSVPVPGHETNIKDVVPEARSFYHELFHLYWGPEMDPAGNEEYVFRRMTGEDERRNGGKFEKPQAMKNPENYALQASVSLFLTWLQSLTFATGLLMIIHFLLQPGQTRNSQWSSILVMRLLQNE